MPDPFCIFLTKRRFDYQAAQTHSVVIPACSHDSAPSDTIVYLANKTLKARHPNAEIEDSVTAVDLASGVAGGTIQTIFSMLEEVPKNVLRFTQIPYSLSPGAPLFLLFAFESTWHAQTCLPQFTAALRIHISAGSTAFRRR
jgi:hypothetical protein